MAVLSAGGFYTVEMDWPAALAQHARHHLGIRATGTDVGWYQHGWNVLQTILEELRFALMAVMRGTAANGQIVPAQFVLGLGNKVYKSGRTGFERHGKLGLRMRGEVDRGDESTKEESVGDMLKEATSLAEAAAAVELS
ncbi:hypothetical protein MHUMG1_04541 [Metarhizium humberi]|uniref:Uncharacterized protein n=1 Tax=Metarhizium humberi TaxID=2596975 RepID=A0A9P8S852_9HYPO|nr:hypothetical protein MHUMG1_04541 [Metarhizium humberi]